MASETEEIRDLLSSTGSELYTQIGIYLAELDFTTDILDDEESEFADLFAEDADCQHVGLPTESDDEDTLKQFIISRTELIITKYRRNSKLLLLKAIHLKNELLSQNSSVYKQIGALLFKYQVHCDDINQVDDLKIFLNKSDLTKMGLKNAAKQKLAFRKVLRIINDLRQTQPNEEEEEKEKDTQTQQASDESRSKQDPKHILAAMLSSGTVSANAFWEHFFAEAQTASYTALGDAIRITMELSSHNDTKRTASAYITSIILSIKCVDSESKTTDKISLDAFKTFTESFNDEDIIETFENTQNEFESLYEADQNKDFHAIQMSNFEETLFKIDIYEKLLSSNFEAEIWKYIICDKFISYLSMIMKLAFKFKKQNNNECGLKVLKDEILHNSNRMSSITTNTKSSFYSLSQSQLLYIVQLESLAMNEEKLFNSIHVWCQKNLKSSGKKLKGKKESIWDKMAVFVPFLRFPLMSLDFLCTQILPEKHKLFAHNDDFLYILLYKTNKFNEKKLCCEYKARTYQQHEEFESLDDKLLSISEENQILRQQNEILTQKNSKLKVKLGRKEKKKRNNLSTMDDDEFAARAKKGRQRSVTNSFAPSHLAAVQAKQATIHAKKKSQLSQDDLDERQKHIKQVSTSLVSQVQGLEVGTSAVTFTVPFTPEQSAESQDIFAQMRKKMTDRAKGKSAHQRKLEKEQQEKELKEEQNREMEETKRRLREEAKKMNSSKRNRRKRPKKHKKDANEENQQHRNNTTMVIKEDIEQNCEQNIIDAMDDDDDDDENDSDEEPTPNIADSGNIAVIEEIDDEDIREQNAIDAIEESLNIKKEIIVNNYGYPQVHEAMKTYFKLKENECTNPTHLILFAKKQQISGVTFASANKYFKGRRNDANAVAIHIEIEKEEEINQYQIQEEHNEDSDSAEAEVESPLITITQSMPKPEVIPINNIANATKRGKTMSVDDADAKEEENLQLAPQKAGDNKSRRKSAPKLDGSKSKKKKKKLLVAAEQMGKLKKLTLYTRFQTPMYILPLNVAEKKMVRDELRKFEEMKLKLGYKVQLHRGNMKATVKFIGFVHFTFGVIVGLEIFGNGNGKHAGDYDKIKYFDCRRNSGLFVRIQCIDKIIEKKKHKSNKKYKELDEITVDRYRAIIATQRECDDDEEIDLSGLTRKEKLRLERFHLEIGDVIEVDKGRKGILHYCGDVHWTDNIMFGIEYIDKAVGKYNGSYGEVQYFKCPEKRGMFFTSDKMRKKGVLTVLTEW